MFAKALVAACALIALASAVPDDAALVTIGSTIKLAHVASGVRLHSQDIPYAFGHGSGQQSVTSIPNSDNEGSFWIVHGVGAGDSSRTPLEAGAEVRLQHAGTRRWLHSHQFRSPLSGAQEVSAFGSDRESDDSDIWILEFVDKRHKGPWKQDEPIRLKHNATGMYLSSHSRFQFGRPISGHQEVACVRRSNANTAWSAAEGVYIVPRQAQ